MSQTISRETAGEREKGAGGWSKNHGMGPTDKLIKPGENLEVLWGENEQQANLETDAKLLAGTRKPSDARIGN